VLSNGFDRELRELGLRSAGQYLLGSGQRVTASGRLGQRSDRDDPFWDLGLGLSAHLPSSGLDWELLGQSGKRHPWADQLWMLRLPEEREEASDPWRRAAQARLLPDPELPDTRWQRQEARLGWNSLHGPWRGQGRLDLRAWRVRFKDQPVERPLD
jgi:hypothetical protein